MIELPKDANGRVIPLDTKVLYDECGNEYKVSRYCCSVRQSIPERVWDAVMLDSLTYYTSRLYLTPPDSWEKLLDDLDRATDKGYSIYCTYFGKKGSGCDSCRAQAYKEQVSRCSTAALCDISSRIRKLRGDD